MRSCKRLLTDSLGATSIEYAIIAGSIALAIVTAVSQIGSTVQELFGSIAGAFPK